MEDSEIILVSPLNWGLGHATRVVPIINNYKNMGHKVIVAAHGATLDFLKNEFPDLEYIVLKGYSIKYARKPFFMSVLLAQMPLFLLSIYFEKLRIIKIIERFGITTVISDNRYGLRNKRVKSILITHQVFIKLPHGIKFLEPLMHLCTRFLIQRFDECWVPDYENYRQSLSGDLSHGKKMPDNIKFIGPLSRFKAFKLIEYTADFEVFDTIVLISGPEPYRTLFEVEMIRKFKNSSKKVLMVCGKPNKYNNQEHDGNIIKVSHINTPELYYYLLQAKNIIARSGYSTIMDMHLLGLQATLIPTPGQTEQEYLAKWHTSAMSSVNNLVF